MQPVLASAVLYTLTADDAKTINQRRDDSAAYHAKHATPVRIPGDPGATGHVAHTGRHAWEGDQFPGIVTGTWPGGQVNLQVLLDGSDTFWAQAIHPGDGRGEWQWPPRAEEPTAYPNPSSGSVTVTYQ